MGSFESESGVTIRGSGEATEEIVMTFLSMAPDISDELRVAGVIFSIGLLSSDDYSSKKTPDSVEEESKDIFIKICSEFVKMRKLEIRSELLISTKRL